VATLQGLAAEPLAHPGTALSRPRLRASSIPASARESLEEQIEAILELLLETEVRDLARFADLGILQFEGGTSSDIDQAIEEEKRRQAGMDRAAA
jgi:hypothetical protein